MRTAGLIAAVVLLAALSGGPLLAQPARDPVGDWQGLRKMKLKREPKQPWDKEERSILRDLLTKMNPYRAIREMHKINGRSIMAIEYQYSKIRKQMKEDRQDA